jgi:hypothetical protein
VPLNIVLPNGDFGIGITARENIHTQNNGTTIADCTTLMSGPENFDIDKKERRFLKSCFLVLAIINIVG